MESLNNIFKIRVLFCTFIKITRELLKLFFFQEKLKNLKGFVKRSKNYEYKVFIKI